MSKIAIVWLRRNLRLEDNKPFAAALHSADKILPIFIYDTSILARFQNPCDRRLSYITNTICSINNELKKLKGKLLVLHGTPLELIPKLVEQLNIKEIYADEDYEPANMKRDKKIQKKLADRCRLNLYCDHLLIKPDKILTRYDDAYKVYTPYMKAFRDYIASEGKIEQNKLLTEYRYKLEGKLFVPPTALADCKSIDLDLGEEAVLKEVGYVYKKDEIWNVKNARPTLDRFFKDKIDSYKANRDFLHPNSTSTLSPYLRFGLISIRMCFRKALELQSNLGISAWVNELIWREFFAYILYHFPNTVHEEFQERFRKTIPWNTSQEDYDRVVNAQTGYPIVDAAVIQLKNEGWIHNRARMIIASFVTKNLLIDWRKGEEFFAQYLMDYELSSNAGGWQWSASVGTDPQSYVRIFNPYLQGKKFDPKGLYVKKHLPALEGVSGDLIHSAEFNRVHKDYPKPLVDFNRSRIKAEKMFQELMH